MTMQNLRRFLAASLLIAFSSAQAEPALVGLVEIRGLNALAADVLRIAAPFDSEWNEESVYTGLADTLELASLNGLDRDGLIRVAIYLPEGQGFNGRPDFLISLPLELDSDAFIQALSERWDEQIMPPNSPRMFFRPADAPTKGPFQTLFARVEPNRLWLASDPQLLPMDGPDFLSPVQGVVAFAWMPRTIAGYMAPLLNTQVEEMQRMAAEMPEEDRAEMDIDAMKMGMDMYLAMFRQLDLIGVGLGMANDMLEVQTMAQAAPDTLLTKLVGSMQPPSDRFLRMIPEDALLASVGHLSLPDVFVGKYIQFLKVMMAQVPDQERMLLIIESSATLMKNQFTGSYAFALNRAPDQRAVPFDVLQLWEIKDTDRMKAGMTNYLAELVALVDDSDVGADSITLHEPRVYRGVEILGYTMDPSLGAPDTAEAVAEFMPFLLDMNYEYAFIDGVMLTSLGSAAGMDASIDRLLDGGGASLADAPAFRQLFPDHPSEFVDISVIRLSDLFQLGADLFPQLGEHIAIKSEDDWANLAGYSIVSGRRVHSRVRIDVVEMIRLIKSLDETPGDRQE